MQYASLIVLGLVAGILSGLLGIGGGILIVPVLNQLFHVPMPLAVGTSLLIIIPTALAGTLTHFFRGNLELSMGLPVMIGAVVGGMLGARLVGYLPELAVKRLFAVLMVYMAIRLFFDH
ncbi:MAG: sulfite exporter TauE/SafE family protein [Firmicutes bacterium]|nr:sulfite exporter TauE/SafE family protein [Bacillota bacterium]